MISLQPSKNYDPLKKKTNPHKILIQSMFAPEGEFDLEPGLVQNLGFFKNLVGGWVLMGLNGF